MNEKQIMMTGTALCYKEKHDKTCILRLSKRAYFKRMCKLAEDRVKSL